jgi:hypothetical protein
VLVNNVRYFFAPEKRRIPGSLGNKALFIISLSTLAPLPIGCHQNLLQVLSSKLVSGLGLSQYGKYAYSIGILANLFIGYFTCPVVRTQRLNLKGKTVATQITICLHCLLDILHYNS